MLNKACLHIEVIGRISPGGHSKTLPFIEPDATLILSLVFLLIAN